MRRLLAAATLAGLLALQHGCDWFRLREPPPPQNGGSFFFPDSAHKVLDNLASAFNEFNLSRYLQSFAPEFRFYPEDRLVNGPTGDLYRNWTLEVESTRVQALFQVLDLGHQPSPVVFTLSYHPTDTLTDEIRFRAHYDLELYLLREPHRVVAAGSSLFVLRKDPADLWHLESWYDWADSGQLSIAEVKAQDF